MRKGALTIIFVSLIAIVVILSFGTITQGQASNNAAIEVDNKNSEILITPTGNSNHLILPEIITTRFIKLSGLTVGDEVRDDFPVIYVKEDAGKVMRVTFNTLWGKKVFVIKLILTDYVKFYIDGELTHIASKIELAASRGFPRGNHTWYTDEALTKEFDIAKLNETFSLYTSTT
jgi:hypothetical protein